MCFVNPQFSLVKTEGGHPEGSSPVKNLGATTLTNLAQTER